MQMLIFSPACTVYQDAVGAKPDTGVTAQPAVSTAKLSRFPAVTVG